MVGFFPGLGKKLGFLGIHFGGPRRLWTFLTVGGHNRGGAQHCATQGFSSLLEKTKPLKATLSLFFGRALLVRDSLGPNNPHAAPCGGEGEKKVGPPRG